MSAPALTPRLWGFMALLALLWGASFLSMRVALDEVPPATVVLWRTSPAAVLLWIVVLAAGLPVPRGWRIWTALLVMGALNNTIPFLLIAWGQAHIETGLTGILNSATAIWGVLAAALLLPDEGLTWRKGIGVALGFTGAALAIGIEALRNLDLRSLAQIAVFFAGMSYALAGVWARKRLRGLPALPAAAGMLTCGSLLTLPLALGLDGPPSLDLALPTWAGIAYVSVAATALAYLLYYRLLAEAGSGNTMVVTLLVAPIAVVIGALVRNEALPLAAYGGLALLALGLMVLDGRLFNNLLDRPRKAR